MKNKRLLTIQDISCVGQCSITVALPIISACGIETSILPSAVLSTHTGGKFSGFTFRDLTEDLPKIKDSWLKNNIDFDAVYTGYIGNKDQINYIIEIINSTLKKDGLLVVDPAMGDGGKLYCGFDKDFVKSMAKLCSKADYILPNLTEASFLLEEDYVTDYDKKYIENTIRKLSKLGAKNVILTGVSFDNEKIGIAIYNATEDKIDYYMHNKVEQTFHGTGDIFSSSFTGALLNNKTAKEAAKIAADFTYKSIENTLDIKDEHWYGVLFEKSLKSLIESVNS